ncbi:MAG: 23S rRNA (guanosine(2251)-2'-O)-methyltransferase RlmB [Hydrotalea flava]|uniref:23S rRNA (guanosine(2251)-2'-O)-methyltransferase RlmB n=1 Tax=Hydrotalea lipotrueae TaxID=2803817 RepID=UPI00169E48CD|nr:23S rRNA (guanosine(2251)-2'-O)-methyltransferase RlmB [Hydrotalea lipotrueae]NIM34673.1 23S rRNA (guanosine(2251)-2'-O)-methyltransferase RlmB [Hydrotalea flava]NIM37508.1 23S rRNA (guanosine(2251)-2'-O)-methyltransferase RlmB [Hydrotalea flava]NIN02680.1 23S rRNA (guanosine(2251)-2'-O)-methyltransferase RlmB [Hydrotalea flava]NIN14351.1 23S rRNA (guanosine(2251)-2'-O)-methyltransferase RlmB [Hydrotalea flava]NIO93434.1 23S rRNA (guanosine(2251)-2'-O)-methyltransferase RlmB [Hydrotalea fla
MGKSSSTLIIGRQPLIAAIEQGRTIDKILLQKNASGETVAAIRQLSKQHQIPIQLVPVEKLNYLSKANHQGVIAFAALVPYMDLQEVINFVVQQGTVPLFVMLDGITDVRNIGAIARSALCCGAQALILPDKGVGALNEEALKSSAGALEQIQVCRVNSLLKAIDTLHLNGIQVFTSEMRADKNVFELNFTLPTCVIMGAEGKGVQAYLAKAADYFFKIPMAGNFNSFNVSVATGIILYEALKQRQFS